MIKEIAEELKDSPYGNIGSKELFEKAKENNIVILYGASDDLLELEGVIREEESCEDGRDFGLNPSEEISFLQEMNLKILWYGSINEEEIEADSDNIAWTFKYNDKYQVETFNIVDDSELNCIGLVVQL